MIAVSLKMYGDDQSNVETVQLLISSTVHIYNLTNLKKHKIAHL